MALFKESFLRSRAARGTPVMESANSMLVKKATASAGTHQFDIFLSHSFDDKDIVLGMWLALEDMGYTVYVDWIHDRNLSRDKVTKETAQVLRERMRNSKSLFFATSNSSATSKWMPWELGFKDGHNKKAAILPIAQTDTQSYVGQEYLGIYPYITEDTANDGSTNKRLWVRRSTTCYTLFESWLQGQEPTER
ncbi:MAG: TIR domain-containing protein [Burkholderiaceae bacterium]|nr:TIR domain-containing protein [Burkholderiaceae bacterium]